MNKHGKFFAFCIAFFISLLFVSCGDSYVNTIKESNFYTYTNKTIGEAVDDFFGSPEWESGDPADDELSGYKLVNCKGEITYRDKLATAEIQFILNPDSGEFELHAFEINGKPQSYNMQVELLEAMFEE